MKEISNPEKILFPEDNITKKEIYNYYSKISSKMIPFLKERLLTVQRFPNGISQKGFFQKNKPQYYPNFISEFKQKNTNYIVCNSKESLLYLANQASLVFHTGTSTISKINFPNKLIFDIDPSNTNFAPVYKAAIALKKILESIKLKPFVMSTGSRGLHIIVPIKPEQEFEEVRDFARKIADFLASLNNKKYTTELNLAKRKGRVFIDVFRNSRAQTSICPYSIRAKNKAPVAAPLDWKELKEDFNPQKYNIHNILKRKSDPWKNINKYSYSLKDAEKKLNKLII